MSWILTFTRIVCTVEGVAGAVLNIYLFFLVAISKQVSTSDRVYKIAISMLSVHGFIVCALIAIMNYRQIFREGTFILSVVGPLEPFIPLPPSVHIASVMVLGIMMWTLVPATSVLQLITLSMKHQYSEGKRLFLSFLFPVLCTAIMSTTVRELLPTREFAPTMIRIGQEFYGVNSSLLFFAGTTRYAEQNNDRTLTFFAVFFAIIPYALTYAALGSLMYQIQRKLRVPGMVNGVLPLLILSSPFAIFVFAVCTQTDLTLGALWFTTLLSLCPSVQCDRKELQAIVRLRYIKQAIRANSQESLKTIVSRVRSRAQ